MSKMRTALLILFLVLPARGHDGCRDWEFKCGDKCVINNRTCKCGQNKFQRADPMWCCHNETCSGGAISSAILDVICPGGAVESLDRPCLVGVNREKCPEEAGITRGDVLSKQCSARKETKNDTESKDKNLLILGLSVGAVFIFATSIVTFAICFYISSRCATYINIYIYIYS